MRKDVEQLIEAYSAALAAHGATPAGLIWPNGSDLATRFEALLRPIGAVLAASPDRRIDLLDLGCGPGLLLDYLGENDLLDRFNYVGVDVLESTIELARSRWPGYHFELRDVRDHPLAANSFDYCIICGVFTGRFALSYHDMEAMVEATLKAIWPSVRTGVIFNVMSKHVDWERNDLFHWPLDDIMRFCKKDLSRYVSLHLDYGLWETAVSVRKVPVPRGSQTPRNWPRDKS